jgi:hypothetical protein
MTSDCGNTLGTRRMVLRVNETLMRVVLEMVAWFEFVSDDVLDPDIAVKEMETVVFLLGQLNQEERREFVAFIEREADATTTDDYRAFLRSLPEAIGLEDN